MLLERVPPFTLLDSSGASSPHHHRWFSGERCCHLFMWPCQYPPPLHLPHLLPHPYALFHPVYLSSKIFLHCHPSSSHPLALHNVTEELLIYIFGHDACQLVVVTPSSCHWYTPPPSYSPLPNDFLLPLASFPLSSSALHKSTWSLDPSKANERHPFPPPVSLALFSHFQIDFFLLPVRTHTVMHRHWTSTYSTCNFMTTYAIDQLKPKMWWDEQMTSFSIISRCNFLLSLGATEFRQMGKLQWRSPLGVRETYAAHAHTPALCLSQGDDVHLGIAVSCDIYLCHSLPPCHLC